MHSSEGERGLRLRDGRRDQGLPPRFRRRYRSSLHGRVEQAAEQGDPGTAADKPRPAGHLRFRMRAQRRGEPVHGARSACRIAPRRGDGPPHETRLRASSPGHDGCPCPGQKNRAGDGQPEHALAVRPLQGLPRQRGLAASRAASKFNTRPSTEAGSTWRRSRSAFCPGSARPGASRTARRSSARLPAAWKARRNAAATPVDWRFRTEDNRVKLKSLYPIIPC